MSSPTCCANPLEIEAPVDRLLPTTQLRLRHLPGQICLRCRAIAAPLVVPSESLEAAIYRCFANDPAGVSILKARPVIPAEALEPCRDCNDTTVAVLLDVGLGEHGGLVIGDVPGAQCMRCSAVVLYGGKDALSDALRSFDPQSTGVLVPSLVYDTPSHPRSVQMEITTRCNLKCEYCSHRHLPVKADLPLTEFKQYLERIDLTKVDNIDFTGLGEPIMNPDLHLMIAEVQRRGNPANVRVVTNGTILDSNRIAELCEAGITSIAFSIDSLDAERFARSRGGASLQKVLRNLETFVRYRDTYKPHPLEIKIKAVLLDDPYTDAEQLLAYSARLGIEMPHFSILDSRADALMQYDKPWLQSDLTAQNGKLFVDWVSQRWLELQGSGPSAGISSEASDTRVREWIHPALFAEKTLCRWAVDAAFISAGGESLSCCEQMIDMPRTYWGSLQTNTLAELWTGELLWGYRLPLSVGHVPAGCIGCAWAPTGGEPMTAAVGELH